LLFHRESGNRLSGEHNIKYTCPLTAVVPQCLAWVSERAAFEQLPQCVVVDYDSTRTVCECTGSTGYGDSEEDGGQVSFSNELAASASIITSTFTNTILHTKVDASTFAKNVVSRLVLYFVNNLRSR